MATPRKKAVNFNRAIREQKMAGGAAPAMLRGWPP